MSRFAVQIETRIPADMTGWEYIKDAYGDWRGINEARGARTRLKRSLEAARHDVGIGRVQRQNRNGEWEDKINDRNYDR